MPRPDQPILYVEDEENDVLLLKLAFDSAKITAPLTVATDGREAIEYLARTGRSKADQHPPPCLVLLDLRLPIVDGFEVLRWIRQQPALAKLPVVIFSSSNAEQDKLRALELGASDYLVKPVDMTLMTGTVRALASKYVTSLGSGPAANSPTAVQG